MLRMKRYTGKWSEVCFNMGLSAFLRRTIQRSFQPRFTRLLNSGI